jgi:hypothetical protein
VFAAMAFSAALPGCSPDGAGTIKIEDPGAVRAKFDASPAAGTAATEKQAKALQAEEEAAKKHPKLR